MLHLGREMFCGPRDETQSHVDGRHRDGAPPAKMTVPAEFDLVAVCRRETGSGRCRPVVSWRAAGAGPGGDAGIETEAG